MNEVVYQDQLPSEGVTRGVLWLSALICASFGVVFGVMALFDQSLSVIEQIAAVSLLAILAGVLVPWWLVRMAVKVRVDRNELRVRLWPFRAAEVPRSQITNIETVTVSPLREYGGWGIKGSKKDRLYGMSGTEGVRVHYRYGGDVRKLTILTSDTEGLSDALGA